MNTNELSARLRQPSGKGGARQLRLQGWIPGVYYGRKEENIHFSVSTSELSRFMRGHHTIISLQIEGAEARPCIIREFKRDPVDDKPVHLDLLGIHTDELLTVSVPVRLVGLPIGVKDNGGILEHGLVELSVECFPKDIPEFIQVEVSSLEVGQSVHVADIEVPNVRILDDPKANVAHVVAPAMVKEETPVAETEEPAAEAAPPKAES